MRNPRRLLYAKDLLMEQMRKYYREEQEDTVSGSAEGSYVISFCTSGDSLLMWSEYFGISWDIAWNSNMEN